MLVVLTIISVITIVTLTAQSGFNKTLILTDTAYTVAFSARQAQSYGLASRKFGALTSNPGYGLHFERVMPTSYIFFADTTNTLAAAGNCPTGIVGTPSEKPGNCRFDTADGKVSTYSFQDGFSIKEFCGKTTAGTLTCSTSGAPLNNLDLVFTRPNTSTTISGVIGSSGTVTNFACALITLTDQTGSGVRKVRVSSLGEVTVGNALACP
jgi:hypothetical protein